MFFLGNSSLTQTVQYTPIHLAPDNEISEVCVREETFTIDSTTKTSLLVPGKGGKGVPIITESVEPTVASSSSPSIALSKSVGIEGSDRVVSSTGMVYTYLTTQHTVPYDQAMSATGRTVVGEYGHPSTLFATVAKLSSPTVSEISLVSSGKDGNGTPIIAISESIELTLSSLSSPSIAHSKGSESTIFTASNTETIYPHLSIIHTMPDLETSSLILSSHLLTHDPEQHSHKPTTLSQISSDNGKLEETIESQIVTATFSSTRQHLHSLIGFSKAFSAADISLTPTDMLLSQLRSLISHNILQTNTLMTLKAESASLILSETIGNVDSLSTVVGYVTNLPSTKSHREFVLETYNDEMTTRSIDHVSEIHSTTTISSIEMISIMPTYQETSTASRGLPQFLDRSLTFSDQLPDRTFSSSGIHYTVTVREFHTKYAVTVSEMSHFAVSESTHYYQEVSSSTSAVLIEGAVTSTAHNSSIVATTIKSLGRDSELYHSSHSQLTIISQGMTSPERSVSLVEMVPRTEVTSESTGSLLDMKSVRELNSFSSHTELIAVSSVLEVSLSTMTVPLQPKSMLTSTGRMTQAKSTKTNFNPTLVITASSSSTPAAGL